METEKKEQLFESVGGAGRTCTVAPGDRLRARGGAGSKQLEAAPAKQTLRRSSAQLKPCAHARCWEDRQTDRQRERATDRHGQTDSRRYTPPPHLSTDRRSTTANDDSARPAKAD